MPGAAPGRSEAIPEKTFDPRRFVNRDVERELFEALLHVGDDARILAIQDGSGMGKSYLLKLFRYRCRTGRPRTPVSLVDLKQLGDHSPMTFIKTVVQDLTSFGLEFPNFARYERARVAADFLPFHASASLQGASFVESKDIRISAMMLEVRTAEVVQVAPGGVCLTEEQDRTAQEVCVRAFFDDMQACGPTDQPVVILMDSFEKCGEPLRDWLYTHFLEWAFFDPARRPPRLLLVVAGWEVPHFDLYWSLEACEQMVRSVRGLDRWTRHHIEECLRLHDLPYEERDVDAFYRLVEVGYTPLQVVTMMQNHPRKQR